MSENDVTPAVAPIPTATTTPPTPPTASSAPIETTGEESEEEEEDEEDEEEEEDDTPPAKPFRLICKPDAKGHKQIWQLGQRWPDPYGRAKGPENEEEFKTQPTYIDCYIGMITDINTSEGDDADLEDGHYEIIGIPSEGGMFYQQGLGTITKIRKSDVERVESGQSAQILLNYIRGLSEE